MSTHGIPDIRELDNEAIDAILARNNVGRIAYTFRDRVDIEPIHYVYEDGWIYGRTSQGTKLATIRHNYWVAFEVDEVEEIFRWRSIVIHGGFYNLTEDESPRSHELRALAVDILRRRIP
jgi:nitroimidazol reductase NimA-like FMN-containing flavoprotein (pyridoxamine 5'-phosphate oxidase superfamily)